MEEVLIFGIGGVGSIVSVFLQHSKRATLSTVARSNYEAVKSNGIRVEGDEISGEAKFDKVYRALGTSVDSNVTKGEKVTKTFSYIVVATKALSFVTPTLVESLEPYVTPGKSTIVLIQNGVGIEDDIQQRWPENLILTCVTYIGAKQLSPGVVAHGGGLLLNVGPFHINGSPSYTAQEKERVDTFVSMVNNGGCRATPIYSHVDMQAERWTKVAWNAAWNGFTALTDLDTSTYLASSPAAEPLARRLMLEIASVSRALGIEIDPHAPGALPPTELQKATEKEKGKVRLEDVLVNRVKAVGPITSSMRTDVQNGRALEADVIFGVPIRHAKRLGIDTPILETLSVIIGAVDARNSGRIKAAV